MEFEVLGPLRVRGEGGLAPLTAAMPRTLLAILLTRANTSVSVDLLVNALWADEPGPRAAKKLQPHVHRLRRALDDPARLRFEHAGYTLRIDPDELDAHRFETLLIEGADRARSGEPERAVQLLRSALGLWRGDPFGDLADVPMLRAEADRLTERRLAGLEDLYRAQLACGHDAVIVPELAELAARYPLREPLQGLLMTALYRAGRQVAALEVFRRTRAVLVDELGLEPGTALQRLQNAILRGDATLEAPTAPANADFRPVPPQPVPPQPVGQHSGVVTDAESAEDLLGVTRDVEGIAALLAALGTTPPLSIVLLGDWGSGKSSFMRQVMVQVEALAEASARVPRESAYAAHVRQVRFNAWHYSDDHLWVGLVEHLFRELADRRHDPIEQGRRAAVQAELMSATIRHRQLSEDLQEIGCIDIDTRWFGWLNRPFRTGRVLRAAGRSVWTELLRPKRILVALAIVLLGAALILGFTVIGKTITGWVTGVMAFGVGLISPAVLVWRKAAAFADEARTKLHREREASQADIRKLEGELDLIDPARRLQGLLTEIGSGDRYERYRGLTGRIRNDLDRLSKELATARTEWANSDDRTAPPLQRIILYVDDLDRCTSERVVEVLQAVNLLLSMPLFVVVAAVDPRWLLRALEDHHESQLGNDQHRRSLQYLDKIFHIPYAMRPMRDRASEYLLSLLPTDEVSDTAQADLPQPRYSSRESAVPASLADLRNESYCENEREREVDHSVSAVEVPAAPATSAPLARPPLDLTDRKLRLSSAEREFLPHLAPLLLTPRAVKKLTNLYRLLRTGVADDQLSDFIGNEQGGPYQAAALLLTGIVSAPEEAESLLLVLDTVGAEQASDILDLLVHTSDSMLASRLAEQIRMIRKSHPLHGEIKTYQQWGSVVARYSFQTYHHFIGD